eukprot:2699497-Pyramimonas_sp.AAC.1
MIESVHKWCHHPTIKRVELTGVTIGMGAYTAPGEEASTPTRAADGCEPPPTHSNCGAHASNGATVKPKRGDSQQAAGPIFAVVDGGGTWGG